MAEKIQDTINKLYEVFSKYPGNTKMQASPNYGNIDKWNSDLFSKPLKELDAQDLSRFTGKALTTWGDLDDFKHFLPRILELTSQLNPPYDVHIVYHKLEYAKWTDWHLDEKEAIIEFNRALWLKLLDEDSEKAVQEFGEYLLSSHHATSEILALWDKSTSKISDIHLAKFIFDENHKLFENPIDKENQNLIQLKEWLLSEERLKRLQNAFFENEEEVYANQISWSEEILRNAIKKTTRNII